MDANHQILFDGKGNSVKLKLQNKAPDINYVHTKRHFEAEVEKVVNPVILDDRKYF